MATLADLGFALAHPTRARALETLMSGRFLSMTDLSRTCRVPASSMSEHLGVLERAGVVRAMRSGKHRYFTLASDHVAHLLETAGIIAQNAPVRSLADSERDRLETAGRFCWKHLAGELGVELRDMLVSGGALHESGDDAIVTAFGESLLRDEFEIEARANSIVPSCVDKTQRLLHMRGPLAAALAQVFVRRKWLRNGPGRSAVLTDAGRGAIERLASRSRV